MNAREAKNGMHIYRGCGTTWREYSQHGDGEYVVMDATPKYRDNGTWNRDEYTLWLDNETRAVTVCGSTATDGHCILVAQVGHERTTGGTFLFPAQAIPLNQVRGEYLPALMECALYEDEQRTKYADESKRVEAAQVALDRLVYALSLHGIKASGMPYVYKNGKAEVMLNIQDTGALAHILLDLAPKES